jgi:hypothetical protein
VLAILAGVEPGTKYSVWLTLQPVADGEGIVGDLAVLDALSANVELGNVQNPNLQGISIMFPVKSKNREDETSFESPNTAKSRRGNKNKTVGYSGWQPAPQKSVPSPQLKYCEQQGPKRLPGQTTPLPQVPSFEMRVQ